MEVSPTCCFSTYHLSHFYDDRYLSDPNKYREWNNAVWATTSYEQATPHAVPAIVPNEHHMSTNTDALHSSLLPDTHVQRNINDSETRETYGRNCVNREACSTAASTPVLTIAPGNTIYLLINLFPGCCMKVPSLERIDTVDHQLYAVSWQKSVDCCLQTDRWQILIDISKPMTAQEPHKSNDQNPIDNHQHSKRCVYLTALRIPGATGALTRVIFANRILRCFQEFSLELKFMCEN